MDFLSKLNFLMAERHLNKSTLSKACGIPYTTIDGWYKRGFEGLKMSTLKKLSDFFDTTLDFWAKEEENVTSLREYQHIQKYRNLDEYGRKWIDTCLDRELERISSYGMFEPPISMITVPYYHKLASAGSGQIIWDDLPYNDIDVPYSPENVTADFALGVNGDSMEPLYWDADIILVKKSIGLDIGEIGVFNLDGECYIKQLGNGKLLSMNPAYPPIEISEKSYFACIGKVICNLTEHSPSEATYKYKRKELLSEYQSLHHMAAAKGMDGTKKCRDFAEKLKRGINT